MFDHNILVISQHVHKTKSSVQLDADTFGAKNRSMARRLFCSQQVKWFKDLSFALCSSMLFEGIEAFRYETWQFINKC